MAPQDYHDDAVLDAIYLAPAGPTSPRRAALLPAGPITGHCRNSGTFTVPGALERGVPLRKTGSAAWRDFPFHCYSRARFPQSSGELKGVHDELESRQALYG
jgi:hypothetical protein